MRVENVSDLLLLGDAMAAELRELRAKYAEAMLLLGLIEQARDFGHVHELLAEFRKPADFPAHKNGEHR